MLYNCRGMENEKESIVPSAQGTAREAENEKPQPAAPPGLEPEGGEPEFPTDLATAFQRLQADKDALHERLLRKQAELENFRKRMQREKDDYLQHATADLIRALLPTLDGFERALKHRAADVPEQFYRGMELIYRDLLEVLKRAGLVPLETVGKTFDPRFHQAVETIATSEYRDQEIVEELQRGYKLRQRLLRPAIVKVAVAPRPENLQTPAEQPASSGDPE